MFSTSPFPTPGVSTPGFTVLYFLLLTELTSLVRKVLKWKPTFYLSMKQLLLFLNELSFSDVG